MFPQGPLPFTPFGATLVRITSQSITSSGADTAIIFTSVEHDDKQMADIVSSPTRIWIPETAYYLCLASTWFRTVIAAGAIAYLRINVFSDTTGVNDLINHRNSQGGVDARLCGQKCIYITAGSYVTCSVVNTSSNNRNVDYARLSVVKISDITL
jgi:hypothetical protein